MAVFAIESPAILLNGVDRAGSIQSVTLSIEADELDATDFADAGWTVPIAGRKSASLSLTFNQDMAAAAIDSIMWPLMFTTVSFEVRHTNAVVGTSNPKYTGNVLIKDWTPLDGSVSDLAQVSVTYPCSGAVTRATA